MHVRYLPARRAGRIVEVRETILEKDGFAMLWLGT